MIFEGGLRVAEEAKDSSADAKAVDEEGEVALANEILHVDSKVVAVLLEILLANGNAEEALGLVAPKGSVALFGKRAFELESAGRQDDVPANGGLIRCEPTRQRRGQHSISSLSQLSEELFGRARWLNALSASRLLGELGERASGPSRIVVVFDLSGIVRELLTIRVELAKEEVVEDSLCEDWFEVAFEAFNLVEERGAVELAGA
jgi:hypothetical protein